MSDPQSSLPDSCIFSTWNIQGRTLERFNLWLEGARTEVLDILALQEVAGLHLISGHDGAAGLKLRSFDDALTPPLLGIEADADSELSGYIIFGSHQLESHLGQVILVDEQSLDFVVSGRSGRRCISVTFQHAFLGCPCFVMGCHLPHKNNSDVEFAEALEEIAAECRKSSPVPVALIAGDFNCQEGDERFLQLTALMSLHKFALVYPCTDTWFGVHTSRRYDFFFVRVDCDRGLQIFEPLEDMSTTVNAGARLQLGCDHALIEAHFLLGKSRPGKARPPRPKFSGCVKACVNPDVLQSHLPALAHVPDEPRAQWAELKKLARHCCFPRPRLKFVDSPALKDLCKQRLCAPTLEQRHALSSLILTTRAAEKQQWWKSIEDRAGQGDPQAIRFFRRRQSPRADPSPLLAASQGRDQAAQAVRDHFHAVMAAACPDELQKCSDLQLQLRERAEQVPLQPFTLEEVKQHVAKYSHSCKTSGPSGIPNELLTALAASVDGADFLCSHMNQLLLHKGLPPEMLEAFVCLIPKKIKVLLPKDLRPISLLEATLKLCGGLLYRRWVAQCARPRSQQGCLPGCQTITSLYLAHALLYKEYKMQTPSLWLLLDVQQAFDSLRRSKLLTYLLRGPPSLSREASKLFDLIQARLTMRWSGTEWVLECNTGVQQGAPPSAGLFGLILGECLDSLFQGWDDEGKVQTIHVDAEGRPMHGWAFADDCILCFRDWVSFEQGFQDLLQAFEELGLKVNLTKTVLLVHEDLWEGGERHFAANAYHPGFQIRWQQQAKYLGRPITHYKGACTLSTWLLSSARTLNYVGWETMSPLLKTCSWSSSKTALHILNRYIFSKWAWCSVMLEPLQFVRDEVCASQVSLLQLLLRVYVAPQLSRDLAMQQHRQRRRAVRTLLTLLPRLQWMYLILKRKWGYAGHCLRRDPAKAELLLVHAQNPRHIVQAIPAPWHSLYTFLADTVRQLGWWDQDCKPEVCQLQYLATDRKRWSSVADAVAMQFVLHRPYVHVLHWESWKVPLRISEVSEWYLAVYVLNIGGSVCAVWLDKEQGCVIKTVASVHLIFPFMFMMRQCFNADVLLDPLWIDVLLPQLPDISRSVWEEWGVVVTFTVFLESWRSHLLGFAGL